MWAVCYVFTNNIAAASCNEAAAVECGWMWPANSVVLRVLNQNAEFFSTQPDEGNWRKALDMAAVPKNGMQMPVLVEYGNNGPMEMQDMQVMVKESLATQKICFVIIYGVTVLMFAVVMAAHTVVLLYTVGVGKPLLWTMLVAIEAGYFD